MTKAITFKNATLEDLPTIIEIYNSTVPGRMVTADTEPVTIEDSFPSLMSIMLKKDRYGLSKITFLWFFFEAFFLKIVATEKSTSRISSHTHMNPLKK